ncbi:MAG: NADH-quinone oxidoreductase subunit M [Myxococcales bacterium]|nr:NADH-quinone oxidoreductase subunit M [Myxococcota bacterium]MDW8282875.1 NADH-quinone oxidoreductase subunit M [Myxococcales bacterium]
MSWILTLTTFLPLLGALVCLLLPREEVGLLRGVGLSVALLTFLFSLGILSGFNGQTAGFLHEVDLPWVQALGIRYHLGVDGISLWLVLLTTFLMPVVMLSSWSAIADKVREFTVAALVLETGMIGGFLALDLFLFYVFFEVMLIPMYFIIGVWGGERRLYAAIKFVLYTMVGSLLLLVAILYLYVKVHQATGTWSFAYADMQRLVLSEREQLYCFAAFALAFCIKVPLFPLHTWLPDAHVEAPTAGSVILASVLLKYGTYGLLRFALPLFPHAVAEVGPLLAALSLAGIIYGSLVAYAQRDIKKLIAYSSVAHMGIVVLGLLMLNTKAVNGAIYQMLAHGISTGALFLCVGVLYERRHTRRMEEFGGLWAQMPVFAGFFLIFTLASVGLPGLCGFVGEFLVLAGTMSAGRTAFADVPLFGKAHLYAALAATGVVLGAVYMLWMFQRVMLGPNENPKNRKLRDLTLREGMVLTPMAVMAFWLGLYPATFLRDMNPAVHRTLVAFKEKYSAGAADAEPRMLGQDKNKKEEGQPPAKQDKEEGQPPAQQPAQPPAASPPGTGATP